MKNLLLILTLFLSMTACKNKTPENAKGQPDSESVPAQRSLKQLSLTGSGYELGFQHGQQLKKEIAEVISKWKANTSKHLKKDADEVLKAFFEYADFTPAIKQWTPELYEEVRGIADGAEQDFNDILVLNLLDEFWVFVNNLKNHHCSDVGVPSINGSPCFIAQNMDIDSYTDGYQTLIRLSRTENRPEQLLLTHPGLIVLSGMNEAGVGVVVNTIMQLQASTDGLPVAFIIRKIINTTDKAELLDFVKSVKHASGQDYMIGIKGEIFAFEASANKVVAFDPKNDNGAIYHTNHPIVNDDLKPWYKEYDPKMEEASQPLSSNSYIRLAALKKRMAGKEVLNEATIKTTLRSKDDGKNPVCRAWTEGEPMFTFASLLMTLTGKPYLQITSGPPSESEYVRVDFGN